MNSQTPSPPCYYADPEWMRRVAVLGEFFNIVDTNTGLKIDFWPLKDEPYAQEQFARRTWQDIGGKANGCSRPKT